MIKSWAYGIREFSLFAQILKQSWCCTAAENCIHKPQRQSILHITGMFICKGLNNFCLISRIIINQNLCFFNRFVVVAQWHSELFKIIKGIHLFKKGILKFGIFLKRRRHYNTRRGFRHNLFIECFYVVKCRIFYGFKNLLLIHAGRFVLEKFLKKFIRSGLIGNLYSISDECFCMLKLFNSKARIINNFFHQIKRFCGIFRGKIHIGADWAQRRVEIPADTVLFKLSCQSLFILAHCSLIKHIVQNQACTEVFGNFVVLRDIHFHHKIGLISINIICYHLHIVWKHVRFNIFFVQNSLSRAKRNFLGSSVVCFDFIGICRCRVNNRNWGFIQVVIFFSSIRNIFRG